MHEAHILHMDGKNDVSSIASNILGVAIHAVSAMAWGTETCPKVRLYKYRVLNF